MNEPYIKPGACIHCGHLPQFGPTEREKRLTIEVRTAFFEGVRYGRSAKTETFWEEVHDEGEAQADKVRWEYEQGLDAPEHDDSASTLQKSK